MKSVEKLVKDNVYVTLSDCVLHLPGDARVEIECPEDSTFENTQPGMAVIDTPSNVTGFRFTVLLSLG